MHDKTTRPLIPKGADMSSLVNEAKAARDVTRLEALKAQKDFEVWWSTIPSSSDPCLAFCFPVGEYETWDAVFAANPECLIRSEKQSQ